MGAGRIARRAPQYFFLPAALMLLAACVSAWAAALDVLTWLDALVIVATLLALILLTYALTLLVYTTQRIMNRHRVILMTSQRDAVLDIKVRPDGALSFSEHNVRRFGSGERRALRASLAQAVRAMNRPVQFRAENVKVAEVYRSQFPELVPSEPDRLGRVTLVWEPATKTSEAEASA